MHDLSTQEMEMRVVHSMKHSPFPPPVKHDVAAYCSLLMMIMFQSMRMSITHFLLYLMDYMNGLK